METLVFKASWRQRIMALILLAFLFITSYSVYWFRGTDFVLGPRGIFGFLFIAAVTAYLFIVQGTLRILLDGTGLCQRSIGIRKRIAWQDVEALYFPALVFSPQAPPRRVGRCRLVSKNGDDISLSAGVLHNYALIFDLVYSHTYPLLYLEADRKFKMGGKVSFGPFCVSRKELTLTEKELDIPWRKIKSIDASKYRVILELKDGTKMDRLSMLDNIPNPHIFAALIEQINPALLKNDTY